MKETNPMTNVAGFHIQKRERTKAKHTECCRYLQFIKLLAMELRILCSTGFQNSLFLTVLDQQMVAEIELKAFNQIGQGNFVATVTEIQLIESCIDVRRI